MKHYMKDFVDRMAEIKKALDEGEDAGEDVVTDQAGQGLKLEQRELLLDELMDLVSSIDYARGETTQGVSFLTKTVWPSDKVAQADANDEAPVNEDCTPSQACLLWA